MRVELLTPDAGPADSAAGDAGAFGRALDAAAAVFTRAERAEDAYAAGSGSLHDAVYRRAQADVTLGVAAAAVQRAAQALQTLLNLQV